MISLGIELKNVSHLESVTTFHVSCHYVICPSKQFGFFEHNVAFTYELQGDECLERQCSLQEATKIIFLRCGFAMLHI